MKRVNNSSRPVSEQGGAAASGPRDEGRRRHEAPPSERTKEPRNPPLLLAPLRVERAALASALPSFRAVRVGMGPARAAAVPLPDRSGPTVVAGLAGGLADDVRPGDVVVASEVRDGRTVTPVPSASLLAGAVRRLGLRVHVGPVYTDDRVVSGARRQELAATGAIAVDMESAPLGARLAAHDPATPFAVLRVVVDTAEHPLVRPGTAVRSIAALRTLRRTAPALDQWVAAAGAREVVLAAPRSFCAGVERAIEVVERALDRHGAPVYVRRQIVHNASVVRDLEKRGAVFVQEADDVPPGAVLVLAAHGVSPAVRDHAAARELTVIDATCPLVSKVHAEVRRYARRDTTVFLVGHADHEEVEGTVGEAPDHVVVVEDVAQARLVQPRDPDRVAYVTQTTLARQDAEHIVGTLRERFPSLRAPQKDDICYATTNRQQAVQEIAADVDLVLVLGSPNSSNSRRLVEVAELAGAPARLLDHAEEVDLTDLTEAGRIGITAGASAPPHLVEELLGNLAGLGPLSIREHRVAEEDVMFTLPPGVI